MDQNVNPPKGLRRRKRKIGHVNANANVALADEPSTKRTAPGPPVPSPQKFSFLHLMSVIAEASISTLKPTTSTVMNRLDRIGSGGSFLVYHTNNDYSNFGHNLASSSVLKRTRRARADDRYAAIVAELQLLSHPHAEQHENIITLLGIAWDVEDEGGTLWPALVLEYAAEGSLDEFVANQKGSVETWGMRVCRDIASALRFLHAAHVAHCDVKAENVLICERGHRGEFVAKLGDFGCALLGVGPEMELSHGIAGTRPWNAPEYGQRLVGEEVFMTDVFSFGMLMWRLMAPNEWFRHLDSTNRRDHTEVILRKIEAAKRLENFIDLAIHDVRKMEETLQTELEALGLEFLLDCDALCSLLKMSVALSPSQRSNMADILEHLELVVQTEQSDDDSQSESSDTPESRSRSDFRLISDSDSEEEITSLAEINDDDDDDDDGDDWEGIAPWKPEESVFSDKFYTHFQLPHHVPGELKLQMFTSLTRHFNTGYETTKDSQTAAYYLAVCYFDGYGVEKDWAKSYEWLQRSASMGSMAARKAIFRFVKTTRLPTTVPQKQLIGWLAQATINGSLQAANDLQTLDQNAYEDAISTWRQRFCTVEGVANTVPNPTELMDVITRLDGSFDTSLNDRGHQAIHVASALGYLDVVKWLVLEKSVDINSTNSTGESALLCACRAGKSSIALWLLQNGADTTASQLGQNPLHWLIAIDDDSLQELGHLLVAKGAELEGECDWVEDDDPQHSGTPLTWAVKENKVAVVQILVELGADPFNEYPIFSPLMIATSNHQVPVVRHLLQSTHATQPRLVDITSIGTTTLLHAVCCSGSFERMVCYGGDLLDNARETIRLLIDSGCNPLVTNEQGYTSFHIACTRSPLDIVQLLLDEFGMSCYINTPAGDRGFTPLLAAIDYDRLEILKLLLDRGADTYYKLEGVSTILHLCAWAADEKSMIKCLEVIGLAERKDLDALSPRLGGGDDEEGSHSEDFTAFDMCVLAGNLEIARMLISSGAQPPTENSDRARALLSALITSGEWKSTQAIQYLLENHWGSFILDPNTRTTALHLAANQVTCRPLKQMLDPLTSEKNFSLILQTFSHPDHINAKTSSSGNEPAGTTPLHAAAATGFYFAVRKLLEYGAQPDAQNESGHTPLIVLLGLLRYFEEADAELQPLGSDFMSGLRDTAKLLHGTAFGTKLPEIENRDYNIEATNLRFSRLGFVSEGT